MKIPRQSRQTAKRYFRACLRPDGTLNEPAVREIFQLLIDSKPRNYMSILARLEKLVELAIDEHTVRLESAAPLPDRGAAIFADLEKRFGPAYRATYEQNPALLGGLRIRRGSKIWDGSISGRLDRLEQAFN